MLIAPLQSRCAVAVLITIFFCSISTLLRRGLAATRTRTFCCSFCSNLIFVFPVAVNLALTFSDSGCWAVNFYCLRQPSASHRWSSSTWWLFSLPVPQWSALRYNGIATPIGLQNPSGCSVCISLLSVHQQNQAVQVELELQIVFLCPQGSGFFCNWLLNFLFLIQPSSTGVVQGGIGASEAGARVVKGGQSGRLINHPFHHQKAHTSIPCPDSCNTR